jgi:hypothetical protein
VCARWSAELSFYRFQTPSSPKLQTSSEPIQDRNRIEPKSVAETNSTDSRTASNTKTAKIAKPRRARIRRLPLVERQPEPRLVILPPKQPPEYTRRVKQAAVEPKALAAPMSNRPVFVPKAAVREFQPAQAVHDGSGLEALMRRNCSRSRVVLWGSLPTRMYRQCGKTDFQLPKPLWFDREPDRDQCSTRPGPATCPHADCAAILLD